MSTHDNPQAVAEGGDSAERVCALARWQRGFDLVHDLSRGINNHQDAYILSRRAPCDGA